MHLINKLCQLCAEPANFEDYFTPRSFQELTRIQKILNLFNIKFEIGSSEEAVCSDCFSLLDKLLTFLEKWLKSQKFLQYIKNIDLRDSDVQNVKDLRDQFELPPENKITLFIKDELNESNVQVEALDCDNQSFNELEDFGIPMDDNSFIITEGEGGDRLIEVDLLESDVTKLDKPDEDLEYSCNLCQEKTKNFYSLQNHCRKEHSTNAEVLCTCGYILTSRSQVHQHKKLHKTNKNYPCKHCEKVYFHQQSLHNHVKKNHQEPEKLFMCPQCPKHFDSEKKLKTHESVHLPDEKKMIHPCPYCDKKFTKNVNVSAHIKSIHQMERPFLCSDCGKDFSTKGALKEHQIIHSDTYPHTCRFCPKKFKNLPRLKTHEDIHNITKYICCICGVNLNSKRTLKMHMVVHDDQKKFKCQYCGSSFKRSKALKNHLILHSGLRPYACPFCEKTFANGSNCRSHKKKAHPLELAALEASGKTSSSALNIPRLEQLQPKRQEVQQVLSVDESTDLIHQEFPLSSDSPKDNLSEIQIVQGFQVNSPPSHNSVGSQ